MVFFLLAHTIFTFKSSGFKRRKRAINSTSNVIVDSSTCSQGTRPQKSLRPFLFWKWFPPIPSQTSHLDFTGMYIALCQSACNVDMRYTPCWLCMLKNTKLTFNCNRNVVLIFLTMQEEIPFEHCFANSSGNGNGSFWKFKRAKLLKLFRSTLQ